MSMGRYTCSPQNRVVEEGKLHLSVVLQGGPAPGGCHVDVGHVERHVHGEERLGGVSHLPSKRRAHRGVTSSLGCKGTRSPHLSSTSVHSIIINQLPTIVAGTRLGAGLSVMEKPKSLPLETPQSSKEDTSIKKKK